MKIQVKNMSNTITLTKEQIEALQSGKSITIEPSDTTIKKVITKWEPKGGKFLIHSTLNDTSIDNRIIIGETHSGLRYQTQAKAEQAAKAIRSYSRQLAWLAENDDGWIADWNDKYQRKYSIIFHNTLKKYMYEVYTETKFINYIFMSQDNVKKLCQLLNDGIVEF